MKILHVAQKTKGGVATHMAQLVVAQAGEFGEANVRIVVAEDEKHYFDTLPPSTLRLFKSSARSIGAFVGMARFAHRMIAAERPDLIHVHSTYAGLLVRGRYLFTRRSQRPAIVYCAHGAAYNMQVPGYQKRIYAWIERVLARVSERIICISGYEYDRAVAVGLPVDKLTMVYNGLPPLTDPITPGVTFDSDRLNLLFIGRNTPQKGLPDLFAAMALLEDYPIHLHIVGDGMAEAPPPNITQHGWQPRALLPSYIAAADIVVMPSHWEGFGLAAIEAMRQARPVCASDVDALPEIVRPEVSGYLFPCGNITALAGVLSGLEKTTLRGLGISALSLFLERFTEDTMITTIAGIYRNIDGNAAHDSVDHSQSRN